VWSDRYKNRGVLCTARSGRDGRRVQQKVQNRRLREDSIIRGGRFENSGVLCTTRLGRDGQRQEQKVQNRRLRQDSIVRSGTYENRGVLCTARPGLDGQRLQNEVQDRRLREDAVVWSDRHKNRGVLCTARPGRDGRRQEKKVQKRRLRQDSVIRVAGTKTAEYCALHAKIERGVEGYGEREVGPHHSGKEAIGNVIPSDAKHTTVHLPPTKTCHLSDVRRDSRKRVQHPEITSTTSKRAVVRESTAGAVTMPDIDGQKSP
ncbi:unnamed protein product, partial [Ascophyllum nodosum]